MGAQANQSNVSDSAVAAAEALADSPVVADANTSITLSASHKNPLRQYTACTAATAVTITVPVDDGTLPRGLYSYRQEGDGQLTFAGATGDVTFLPSTFLKSGAKYAWIGLIYKGSNVWSPIGCLVP